jgi:hypothetical protein
MRTFTVNGAAELLERDRRTVKKALRNVNPDCFARGSPRWRLTTIVDALGRTGEHSHGAQLIDQIEADFKAFDAGFAKLEAEPDLDRRRQLDKELGVGNLIGHLDRQMERANAAIGEEQGFGALASDKLVGDLISRFLTLLDYRPTGAEMDKLRADGNARESRRKETFLSR